MKNNRFSNRNNRRRLKWNKQFLLLVSITILILGTVGGSLAYLVTKTGPVENVFTPGKVDIEIDEPGWSDGGTVKNNVAIINQGNTPAYIRAMIVVTWQKEDGSIHPTKPEEGKDYTITWTKDGWSEPVNGWYTTTSEIAGGDKTGVLFTACGPVADKAPEGGYHLVVDVIAEAIQADQKW